MLANSCSRADVHTFSARQGIRLSAVAHLHDCAAPKRPECEFFLWSIGGIRVMVSVVVFRLISNAHDIRELVEFRLECRVGGVDRA